MLAEALGRTQRMVLNLQKQSLERLVRTSTLMTDNPTLRAAMETYQTEVRPGAPPRPDLLATIQREAEKIALGLGSDLLVVTDRQGKVLAASAHPGSGPAVGDDLSPRETVRLALRQAEPVGPRNFAVLDFQAAHFQVGCVPILLQGFIIGTLTLGDRIDQGFAARLRESFDSDAVITAGDEILSSTLPPGASGMAVPEFGAAGPAAGDAPPAVVMLGDGEYITAPLPLGRDGDGRPVTLHLLHSLTRALEPLNRALRRTLLSYGTLAAILAGLAAWLVSRSILRPLESFVAFMGDVAASGDHAHRYDGSAASREVQTLSETYNRLMESLEQHERRLLSGARDEIDRMERLKESEKLAALGRLLSGAAHEINNPLTGVVGNIEMLLTDARLDERVRPRLELVRREGQRIVALVRSLLKVAHRDSGQRAIVDMNQVVRDTLSVRQHDFSKAGMRLNLDLSPEPVRIHGNELELQQVFLNIVNNAFDALKEVGSSRSQPALSVRTAVDGDRVDVTFADNGPGMESPEHVFDHFYTTKPVGKGTGLGLSISHAIVRNHGGRITAENLPGGGACFRIAIPSGAAPPAAAERIDAPKRPMPSPRRSLHASVLVVDDEPTVLDLQMSILASVGASAVGVGSGEEAVAVLKEKGFDLIVSDLKMPGEVSGKELFRWVETNRPAGRDRFLFVTGDTMGESEFLEQVKARTLLKPFTMEEYLSALRETLDALRPAA